MVYKKLIIFFLSLALLIGLIFYFSPNKYDSVKVGDPISEVLESLGEPTYKYLYKIKDASDGTYAWQNIKSYRFSTRFPFYEKVYSLKSVFIVMAEGGHVTDLEYIEDLQQYLKKLTINKKNPKPPQNE